MGLELLTTEEMARADRLAVEAGVAGVALMEQAGRAVAAEVVRRAPAGARVGVLCGPGNNGGDGFVVARVLAACGYSVRLAVMVPLGRLVGDAAVMAERWCGPSEPWHAVGDVVGWADVLVDAMFGAGLRRQIEGEAAAAVEAVNASGKTVIAVDVPSGLDGTSGAATGPVIRAAATVTFFRRKPGHLLFPGRELCGRVTVADIGIPGRIADEVGARTFANSALREIWVGLLQPDLASHKYRRGHAVVVAGPAHGTGAARLGARGALRVGAGLVTLVCPPEAADVVATHSTAVMVKAFADASALGEFLTDPRHNAVLIGPGAGVGRWTSACVEAVLQAPARVVLDADALTSFEADPSNLWQLLAGRRDAEVHSMAGLSADLAAAGVGDLGASGAVLTPHEGEFRRLFGELSGSKLDRAREAARICGAVVVLKGPDTVIAAPDGMAAINDNAPPWLATAGSGDVLAGLVTGLMAQGLAPFLAACAGVWLHGACGQAAGPGLIAEDLPEALPGVLGCVLGSLPAVARGGR